ncbi:MAG: single-stranded DNA-binding protein [Turicibacter sp.]|nr:single-stranded DNA-binding protein [Turicibacter sp.]
MNKVILIGRFTRDPEIRYSQAAEPVAIARFTLAVNRRFKREGEPDADFINCVAFGKSAEFVEKYFKKGMQAAVAGRLTIRTFDDAAGKRNWYTEVITEEINFTESRAASESRAGSARDSYYDSMAEAYAPPTDKSDPSAPPEGFAAITESIDDDDLPF